MKKLLLFTFALAALSFAGCSEKTEVEDTNIQLKVGEKYQFSQDATVISDPDATYATIDENNTLTALCAGETSCIVRIGDENTEYRFTISTTYTLFTVDMEATLGKTEAEITALFGTPAERTPDPSNNRFLGLAFEPKTGVEERKYFMFLIDGVCESSEIFFPASHRNKLMKHLAERYPLYLQDISTSYYVNSKYQNKWTIEIMHKGLNASSSETSAQFMTRNYAENWLPK